jgi:hypothetical protein
MIVGRMPTAEEGRMVDAMLIVLVDHGMTTAPRIAAATAPGIASGAGMKRHVGYGSDVCRGGFETRPLPLFRQPNGSILTKSIVGVQRTSDIV